MLLQVAVSSSPEAETPEIPEEAETPEIPEEAETPEIPEEAEIPEIPEEEADPRRQRTRALRIFTESFTSITTRYTIRAKKRHKNTSKTLSIPRTRRIRRLSPKVRRHFKETYHVREASESRYIIWV